MYIHVYIAIFIYIYIYIYKKRRYVGRNLYVGGGKAAPPKPPPQLLFMRGSAPQTPHIILYGYFWAPQKDAE